MFSCAEKEANRDYLHRRFAGCQRLKPPLAQLRRNPCHAIKDIAGFHITDVAADRQAVLRQTDAPMFQVAADLLMLHRIEAGRAQQGRQRSHQILRHGNDAVSAPLAVKKHLRTAPLQLKIVRVDADRFGHAGAGSGQKKQKDPVAPSAGCRLIGGRDNGVHFRAVR